MAEAESALSSLTARTLLTPTGPIDSPVITFDPAGRIGSIHSDPASDPDNTTTLTPTFLDIHLHGAAHHDVMSPDPASLPEVQRFLATHGVGHYLPTTVTAPIDQTLAALDRLASAIESSIPTNQATPIGVHLEGPFISHAKRGVHPPDLILSPSIELFARLQQAARGHIRLLTLAPETPGALALIEHATRQGTVVTLGHSNATAAQTLAAIAAGATSATHTFNAMRPLDHREPGILGTVLDSPDLFAELICDGVHVAPPLVRLWLRSKSSTCGDPDHSRAILVSDSISATGMPDGTYALGNLQVAVAGDRCTLIENGRPTNTLAGSVLTLDRAVANLIALTGSSLVTAVRCASHTPATLLGLAATLAPILGNPANFNRYSPDGHLIATYLHGRQVSARDQPRTQ